MNAEPGVPCVLAVDHGTSGCKVALMTVYGETLGFEFEPVATTFLAGGGAEQDPEEWWRAFVTAARKLTARYPARARCVVAASVSSTYSSTVAVDRNGAHLMNSLMWMDSRGAPYVRAVMGGFPGIAGYALKNLAPWIRITGGGPQLSGKDDIAHVLFLKHERPEIYERTYKFLSSKDYFNLRLSGEFAAGYDSSALFWVTDIRDLKNIRYSDRLIAKLKIDKEKLPRLMWAVEVVGTIRPHVAELLGLPLSVKIVGGAPDHQTALVGSGAVRPFELHLYIGTSSWLEALTPFKKTDLFHSIATLPAALPERYQCINEQDIAGGALSYVLNNLIYPAGGLGQSPLPTDCYARVQAVAERVPPGSNQLIFTPWLNGERSPVDNNSLRGCIFNLSLRHTMNDIVRAVLEGVAYNTKWNLKYVERFLGRSGAPLRIIGGGAQSELWCQIFADVLERTVHQVRDPIQANARGAALLASVGLGFVSEADLPEVAAIARTFEPNPATRGVYRDLFGVFIELYRRNKSLFRKLNG